ncbi:hypothetical protein [Rathayibacter sp. AY1A7]|uniref:hypothetical protein n=1 Tax=Rathayibacter sp. AY1A7 TaxID=2080524 RepID=UPI0011B04B61|nr:hypothetical protein [Rathayibacter sp. AY1A7]
MTGAHAKFIGPALIVDDTYDSDDSTIAEIVSQIQAAGFPLIGYRTLPSLDEVPHWRGFSMIIFDWDLKPIVATDDSLPEFIEEGVRIPGTLDEDRFADLIRVLQSILENLYCPVYILSTEDPSDIWQKLISDLSLSEDRLRTRIMVRRKSEVAGKLFSELDMWARSHPAVYALRNWNEAYEAAKISTFGEFEGSSVDWSSVLWAASSLDGVNQSHELAEVLSRNILHRFKAITFDASVVASSAASGGGGASASSVRRVIHRASVVPNDSLHEDVLMPGDFFRVNANTVYLNVTPACDLVPRKGQHVDAVRIVTITGKRVKNTELRNNFENYRRNDSATSHVIHVLKDDATPYRFSFGSWGISAWGDLKETREGRLIDPHITQILQKFGSYFLRQGVPRLPEVFYAEAPPAQPPLESTTEVSDGASSDRA